MIESSCAASSPAYRGRQATVVERGKHPVYEALLGAQLPCGHGLAHQAARAEGPAGERERPRRLAALPGAGEHAVGAERLAGRDR
jgi:hypothetical protein